MWKTVNSQNSSGNSENKRKGCAPSGARIFGYGFLVTYHKKAWTPCSRKGLCADPLFEIKTSCSPNLTENLVTVEDSDLNGNFRGKYETLHGWKVKYVFKINLI